MDQKQGCGVLHKSFTHFHKRPKTQARSPKRHFQDPRISNQKTAEFLMSHIGRQEQPQPGSTKSPARSFTHPKKREKSPKKCLPNKNKRRILIITKVNERQKNDTGTETGMAPKRHRGRTPTPIRRADPHKRIRPKRRRHRADQSRNQTPHGQQPITTTTKGTK